MQGPTYGFGPYRLDSGGRRLARDGEPVAVPDRPLEILLLLVSHAGQVLSKERLIQQAWKDVAVSDNSLEQAISSLRRVLGRTEDGSHFIETVARRGYRFSADVSSLTARQSDATLEHLVAPYLGFVEGRAALESLERDAVLRAQEAFADVVEATPDYAAGHIGLANAYILGFEATRADEAPDVSALAAAHQQAQEACRLDPASGEAWATLGFVLSRTGAKDEAAAATRRAVALEPNNWRHSVRLGYVTWGEERLQAARRALVLLPGAALAHWLAATVYVARQALDEAERELVAGTVAEPPDPTTGRLGGVGLHLLLGLVHLSRGNETGALRELAREVESGRSTHVYAREASGNAWYATGAVKIRQGQADAARGAFGRALDMVPAHPGALAGLAVVAGPTDRGVAEERLEHRLEALRALGAPVEAAVIAGVREVCDGHHDRAAELVHAALRAAPTGTSGGWIIPIEPLLQVAGNPGAWAPVLATLRSAAA